MQVEITRTAANVAVATIVGDVDLTQAARLRAELSALDDAVIVVDLTKVEFIDSTGLGVLVGRLRSARQNGRELRLAMRPGRVRRNFEITGLDRIFPIFGDLDSACREGRSA